MAEERQRVRDLLMQHGTWVDGVKIGLWDLTQQQTTWAQRGVAITSDAAYEMESTLSDVFFDGLHGDLQNAGDYFRTFTDGMIRSWTDMASQMVTEYAASGLKGLLTGDGGDSLVSGIVGAAGGIWDAVDWLGSDLLSLWHTGAWMVDQDQVARLKAGEMVVPPNRPPGCGPCWKTAAPASALPKGLSAAGYGSMSDFAADAIATGGLYGAVAARASPRPWPFGRRLA